VGGVEFTIEDLGDQIEDSLGFPAKVVFCVGLYAAAFSSAITCPLGAALTAEQILYEGRQQQQLAEGESASKPSSADSSSSGGGGGDGGGGGGLKEGLLSDSDTSGGAGSPSGSADDTTVAGQLVQQQQRGAGFEAHGRYFRLSMVVSVAVAVAVASSGVSTVGVISAAQVRYGVFRLFLLLTIYTSSSLHVTLQASSIR
jgi:Mn2+/Fe2+ NRAMP family transporter